MVHIIWLEVIFLKIQWKKLIFFLAIPLAVGGLSALLTRKGMDVIEMLNKPPLSPPGWLFPVVWIVLYLLMGFASYLVATSGKQSQRALVFYGLQLGFNFFWSIIFFNLGLYLLAFIWLVVLWLLILITTIMFFRIAKLSGYLMIPYLMWVSFAGYLNLAIFLLNK